MNRTLRLLLPAVLLAPPIQARTTDSDSIDEIQVTATRRPLEASRVSSALTVIDRDRIANEKLATDALAAEAGVYLQQTTVGQGAAIIRGLKGSEILHLVDGLRLNNTIFRNAPTQYLALVPPGSIERLEVVRGSPTSLYGSDAVGGVIQVVSRLPRFDGDGIGVRREIAAAADSAELGKSLRASLDVGNRALAGLLSVAHQESGNRRIGGGERVAPSGFESTSARAALHARPAEDRSWVLDWQFTRQPSTPRVDELVPGFGQTEPASAEFYFEPNERHFVHARHTRDDGLWSADWTVDLGWQRIVDDRSNRNFGEDVRTFEDNSSDLYGLSVSAAREFGETSWIFGGELYHDEVRSSRSERDLVTGGEASVQARFPDGATADQAGLYAHVSRPVGERHQVSGGVRVSAVDIALPATALSPPADVGIEDVSADVGWLTDLGDVLQVGVNVGRGFRAPNVFDLGTLGARPGNRFNVPNPSLGSERVTHYDVTLRRRAEDWEVELTAFRLDYTDRIQSVVTGDTTVDGRDVVQSRNVGRADIRGFEAGFEWHPAESFTAELVVNQTRGRQQEPGAGTVPADRIPPLNGRLSVDWALADVWSLGSSVVFADAQDRLSPRDERDSRIDPTGTPGWARLDVGLTWRPGDAWRLTGGVDNLLDRRYRVHGSGIDAPGRNVYLTVSTTR